MSENKTPFTQANESEQQKTFLSKIGRFFGLSGGQDGEDTELLAILGETTVEQMV